MGIVSPEALSAGRTARDAILTGGTGDPDDAFDAGAIVASLTHVVQYTEAKDLEIKALRDEIADLHYKINNGFQGGCYCCEIVALENQKLAAIIARLGQGADDESMS